MRKIKLIFALFASLSAFAQVTKEDLNKEIKPLKEQVNNLQSENSKLKSEINILSTKLSNSNKDILKLGTITNEIKKNITSTESQLNFRINETGKKSEGKISKVSELLSKNSLYGIIGVLSALILTTLLYWLLSKRQNIDKSDFLDQLSKTKSSIEDSLVKEFSKQTELMDSQLRLLEEQKTTMINNPNSEIDHSLALKFADQIVAIERSIGLMDEKTKGLQRIKNSITNLKDNLSANGYELPELIGKTFNQGMKIIVASSIPDDNLKKGEEIITRIVKPQVNFNDKMIQAAQVEVSVGY